MRRRLPAKCRKPAERNVDFFIDEYSGFGESVGVRFDKIGLVVVGEDRALLRHHINAFGEA